MFSLLYLCKQILNDGKKESHKIRVKNQMFVVIFVIILATNATCDKCDICCFQNDDREWGKCDKIIIYNIYINNYNIIIIIIIL